MVVDYICHWLVQDSVYLTQYLFLGHFAHNYCFGRNIKAIPQNNSVAYRQDNSPSIKYGQIEVFFKAPLGSRTSCGAVVVPLSRTNQDICKQHEVLGRPVSHIIALHHPNRHFSIVVPLEDIIMSGFLFHSLLNILFIPNLTMYVNKIQV